MKILHINGTCHGGAANVAERIHQSLLDKKVESYIYLPFKKDLKNLISPTTTFGEILNIAKPSIVRRLSKVLNNSINESLSFGIFPSRIKKIINDVKPDVVNLHWIGNEIISLKNINDIKCPVVWTLLDMWPFLGAEHYSNNERYIEGYFKNNRKQNEKGSDLNRWNWKRKIKYLNKNFNIVSPSDWLTEKAKKSFLFKDKIIEKIHYPLNVNEWKPIEKKSAKNIINLNPNKKTILFGAIDGPQNYRKGFDLLIDAISKINEKDKYQILTFGKKLNDNSNLKGIELHSKGHISDNYTLRLFYSAADVSVIPSRFESFGQVALESASCGTPSVSFSNTGINEIIEHKINGYLAKYEDSLELKKGIEFILDNSENINFKENCISKAKEFSYEKISEKYISLYKRILKND